MCQHVEAVKHDIQAKKKKKKTASIKVLSVSVSYHNYYL